MVEIASVEITICKLQRRFEFQLNVQLVDKINRLDKYIFYEMESVGLIRTGVFFYNDTRVSNLVVTIYCRYFRLILFQNLLNLFLTVTN